jgi:hypothetical protein
VAELADAQDSGSCVRKDVGVQVPPRPRLSPSETSRTDEPQGPRKHESPYASCSAPTGTGLNLRISCADASVDQGLIASAVSAASD